jgi:hypothetical protein
VTKKKHEDPKAPVLGTGAAGDPQHPAEGAPVDHEQFEPAPVNAPEKIEKEKDK